MEHFDFAVHVRRDGNRYAWAVLDEEGRHAQKGVCENPERAEHEARLVARDMSRFRKVTKGGW